MDTGCGVRLEASGGFAGVATEGIWEYVVEAVVTNDCHAACTDIVVIAMIDGRTYSADVGSLVGGASEIAVFDLPRDVNKATTPHLWVEYTDHLATRWSEVPGGARRQIDNPLPSYDWSRSLAPA